MSPTATLPTPPLSELQERYKAMPRTKWFKDAHDGRPLGEGAKIE